VYRTDEPYILANQATQIFFLEETYARSQDWRILQKFEQRNSFNEVTQQDDAYTAADVEESTDVYDMFVNHHINKAGEKIACQAGEVDGLINKKPTFEDIEDEEEDDTGGELQFILIHMAKMLTLLLRMMIRLLLSYFPMRRRLFIYYVKLCLL
jgi:hypothetical protein